MIRWYSFRKTVYSGIEKGDHFGGQNNNLQWR